MIDLLEKIGLKPQIAALLVIFGLGSWYTLHFGYTWAENEHVEIKRLQESYELRGLRKEARQIRHEIRQLQANPVPAPAVKQASLQALQGDLEQVEDEIKALKE